MNRIVVLAILSLVLNACGDQKDCERTALPEVSTQQADKTIVKQEQTEVANQEKICRPSENQTEVYIP